MKWDPVGESTVGTPERLAALNLESQ